MNGVVHLFYTCKQRWHEVTCYARFSDHVRDCAATKEEFVGLMCYLEAIVYAIWMACMAMLVSTRFDLNFILHPDANCLARLEQDYDVKEVSSISTGSLCSFAQGMLCNVLLAVLILPREHRITRQLTCTLSKRGRPHADTRKP